MKIAPQPAWMSEAICAQVDPELFFPDKSGTARPAQAICRGCPVRRQCAACALEHDELGVWGGMSRKQRQAARAGSEAA